MTADQAEQLLNIWRLLVAVGATIFLIVSIIFCFVGDQLKVKATILLLWALLPPVWFLCKYYFLGRYLNGTDLTTFKDLQDLSRNIWAGGGCCVCNYLLRPARREAALEAGARPAISALDFP